MDLGASTDVDAACRVVEDQDRRVGDEPAGDLDLLLVAAAECRHGGGLARCADGQLVDAASGFRADLGLVEKWAALERGEAGNHDILRHRVDPHECVAAVLGDVADALGDRCVG